MQDSQSQSLIVGQAEAGTINHRKIKNVLERQEKFETCKKAVGD